MEGKVMAVENIFEYAVRKKLRFPFKGTISTEDLWDLSVEDLDRLFQTLNAKVKQNQEESLLDTKKPEEETLEVQIAIVRHIVSVKLAEKEAKKKEVERKKQKQKILSIIAEKQDEALKESSVAELKKMLEELEEH